MIADDSLARTYQLRDVAPDILLLGNIGLSQAARMKTGRGRSAWSRGSARTGFACT